MYSLLQLMIILGLGASLLGKPAVIPEDVPNNYLIYQVNVLPSEDGISQLPGTKTEVLINNTMVAGGMLYRFLRALFRAGTIAYSYLPISG